MVRFVLNVWQVVVFVLCFICLLLWMFIMCKFIVVMFDLVFIVYVVDDDLLVCVVLEDLLVLMGLQVWVFVFIQVFFEYDLVDVLVCLVLDVCMFGQSGFEFYCIMGSYGLQLLVVFIIGYGDIVMGVNVIKDGVIEFFIKFFCDQELFDVIYKGIEIDCQCCCEGEVLGVLQLCWNIFNVGEWEVVDGVVCGCFNKQIVVDFGVSEIIVKVCCVQVMCKMGVCILVDLVCMYDCLQVGML